MIDTEKKRTKAIRQVSVGLSIEEEERIIEQSVYGEPLSGTIRRLAIERCEQLEREGESKNEP